MLTFRLASAAPRKGDYLLTLLVRAPAPTGSHKIRMHDVVLSPGIAFGKGWGRFDVQSTIGANLPTADTASLGRQFLWNTASASIALGNFYLKSGQKGARRTQGWLSFYVTQS
jgi:hypothetical protein